MYSRDCGKHELSPNIEIHEISWEPTLERGLRRVYPPRDPRSSLEATADTGLNDNRLDLTDQSREPKDPFALVRIEFRTFREFSVYRAWWETDNLGYCRDGEVHFRGDSLDQSRRDSAPDQLDAIDGLTFPKALEGESLIWARHR